MKIDYSGIIFAAVMVAIFFLTYFVLAPSLHHLGAKKRGPHKYHIYPQFCGYTFRGDKDVRKHS